jgi:hypothetical protein
VKKNEIKVGAVLAWMSRYTMDARYQDMTAQPVRIMELDREKPIFTAPRMGRTTRQTGTRRVIVGVLLDPATLEPWPIGSGQSGEVEVTPKNCTGTWAERMERVEARTQYERNAMQQREARENRHRTMWAEAKALFVQHDRFSASLDSRGRVCMDVEDFLAAIKSARTQALDEMEGTGGRHG